MSDKAMTEQTAAVELCPCPFCGCQAWLHEHGRIFAGAPGFRVECEGACHAMTCYWHTRAEAVTAWNRRSAPTDSLASNLSRTADALANLIGEVFDPGSEALAALHCARAALRSAPHGSVILWSRSIEATRRVVKAVENLALYDDFSVPDESDDAPAIPDAYNAARREMYDALEELAESRDALGEPRHE